MKNLLKRMKENEKGFTLIELIVVIAIIGILAAVLLPKFSGFTDKARQNAVLSEAKNLYTAYSAVKAEKGVVTDAEVISYLGKAPKDAAGTGVLSSVGAVTTPASAGGPIIQYTTNVSGKKYDVTIKDGGEITITPKTT